MRAFVSINIPSKIKRKIKKIQDKLPEFYGKKTELKNLHLTLKFLGEVCEKKIEEIKKRLRKIRLESFEAKIDYLGFFDNRKSKFYENNFIIWIHLKNCDKLQKEINEKLKDLFKKENRFMGHLTIARIKNVENKKEFLRKLKNIKIPELNFNVDSFYLMKSELLEKGPKYFIIEKYKLK